METNLTQSQQLALVSLLSDADSGTADMVKNELILGGATRLEQYEKLMRITSGQARTCLEDVIYKIESADALGNISRGLARLRTFNQAEELCWELTRAEQPGFKSAPYKITLDGWAEEVAKRIAGLPTGETRIQAMTDYLAGDERLTGNTLDYYHPRNCFLPWVIEFRCGLPITLTMIYILVGKRIGLDIDGISAPGHFLARMDGVIFDPYHAGRVVSGSEWDRICNEVPAANKALVETACTPVNLIHRLLINLRNSYVKRDDSRGRKRIDSYLAVLQR